MNISDYYCLFIYPLINYSATLGSTYITISSIKGVSNKILKLASYILSLKSWADQSVSNYYFVWERFSFNTKFSNLSSKS